MLEKDIKKVLVSHDEIVEAAKKLGETLTKEYQGKKSNFCWNFERLCSIYGRVDQPRRYTY